MKYLLKIASIFFLSFTLSVNATEAELNSKVISIMTTHDNTFGGCMARFKDNIKTLLPECGSNWVTFSCTGEFVDEERALRMFDQAQLSFTANTRVSVTVDDQNKIGGYCLVKRIDIHN